MLNLNFEIEGEKQVSRRLERVGDEVQNWYPAFRDIGEDLTGFFSGEVFDTQGAVFGEPWQPLSESTKRQKAKKGYPMTPLIRTGTMRKSFKSTATPKWVQVYNTTDYFKYHQSNKPRSKLPRRVMMKLDEIRRQMVVKQLYEHYLRKLNAL
jgi:phage gpG-like protein